jgi:hypothetical protein
VDFVDSFDQTVEEDTAIGYSTHKKIGCHQFGHPIARFVALDSNISPFLCRSSPPAVISTRNPCLFYEKERPPRGSYIYINIYITIKEQRIRSNKQTAQKGIKLNIMKFLTIATAVAGFAVVDAAFAPSSGRRSPPFAVTSLGVVVPPAGGNIPDTRRSTNTGWWGQVGAAMAGFTLATQIASAAMFLPPNAGTCVCFGLVVAHTCVCVCVLLLSFDGYNCFLELCVCVCVGVGVSTSRNVERIMCRGAPEDTYVPYFVTGLG